MLLKNCKKHLLWTRVSSEKGKSFHENFNVFEYRSLAKNVKIFAFSQNLALICFAKKCGIFANYKMCQLLYLLYTLCFYYSTWCIHNVSNTVYSTWCLNTVSTTLPDVYTMFLLLYLMYTLYVYYSTWCLHYLSTTLPDVYTMCLLLFLMFTLFIYYFTWCIHYASTTLPDVYTTCLLIYLMYTQCI